MICHSLSNVHHSTEEEVNRTAGTAWDKFWDNLDRASQLGTLLGVAGVLANCPVLSSAVQAVQGEGWFADAWKATKTVLAKWTA